MPSLYLFGHSFSVAPSTAEPGPKTIEGATGEFWLWLKPGQVEIQIRFEGNLPHGYASFTALVSCRVNDGVVQLIPFDDDARPTADLVRIDPSYLARSSTDMALPIQVMPADSKLGLGFLDKEGVAETTLMAAKFGSGTSAALIRWRSRAPDLYLSFNAQGQDSTIRFARLDVPASRDRFQRHVELSHSMRDRRGRRRIIHKQGLMMVGASADANEIKASFMAENGLLWLQADILDTHLTDKRGRIPENNQFLFQYALVNGQFVAASSYDVGRWSTTLSWQGSGDTSSPPALVLPRLTDESGTPLVFVEHGLSDQNKKGIPIMFRRGLRVEAHSGIDADALEQTNSAVVVGRFGPKGEPTSIEGRLRRIDPLTVSRRRRKDRKNDRLKTPCWMNLSDRSVKLSRAPWEIHGLAQGAFLEWNGTSENPGDEGANCVLEFDRVDDDRPDPTPIFIKSNVRLTNRNAWQLVSQLEEREVTKKGGAEHEQVGRRVAISVADAEPLLPAIDTNYALANMTGRGREQQIIKTKGDEWVNGEIGAQYTGGVFRQEEMPDQQHQSGARIGAPVTQRFHDVLDTPPIRAQSPHNTGRTGVMLVAKMLPHRNGLDTATSAAILDSAQLPPDKDKLSSFVFGGDGRFDATIIGNITEPSLPANEEFLILFQRFQMIWNGGEVMIGQLDDLTNKHSLPAVKRAYSALRDFLSSELPKYDDPVLDNFFDQGAQALRDLALQNVNESDREAKEWPPGLGSILEQIEIRLRNVTAVQLKEWWKSGLITPLDKTETKKVLEYLWRPADQALFRTALRQMLAGADKIKNHLDVIKDDIVRIPKEWQANVMEQVNAIPGLVKQGVEDRFDAVFNYWKDQVKKGAEEELDKLWAEYGNELTGEVYEQLVEFEAASAKAVEVYNGLKAISQRVKTFQEIIQDDAKRNALINAWRTAAKSDLEAAAWKRIEELRAKYPQDDQDELIDRIADAYLFAERIKKEYKAVKALADLMTQKPDYLFLTKRFKTAQREADDHRLWNHNFDLAKTINDPASGQSKGWRFFPDTESTIIIKLGGNRNLANILREIHDAYVGPERPNPLGIIVEPGNPEQVRDPVKVLLKQLHPDILIPSWRGSLFIRPTADFADDKDLSDIIGFPMITAQYVAVGGGKLDYSDLDVYGYILKQAEVRNPDEKSTKDKPRHDLHLTLTRFEAMIKRTQLESGKIEFKMDMKDIFGTKADEVPGMPTNTEDKPAFKPVIIRGTLPPKKEDKPDQPRSFEFGAWFQKPEEFKLDVLFIKSLVLHSIRVARSKGKMALEIDADLKLKKAHFGDFTFNQVDFEGLIAKLRDFRVVLPRLGESGNSDIGAPRLLDFEYPAVSIDIPKPRPLNLGGLELKPIGLGYFRFKELPGVPKFDSSAFTSLRKKHIWFGNLPDPGGFEGGDQIDFPHIRCLVDFGQLPALGAVEANGLVFEATLGFCRSGDDVHPVFGISKAAAEYIKIDLFRLLTLEIENFKFAQYKVLKDIHKPTQFNDKVSAVMAENIRLKLFGWNPLGDEDVLQFLMMQGEPGTDRTRATKGALGFLSTAEADKFIGIKWLLVAHNLALDPKVVNYLMWTPIDDDGAANIIEKLVEPKRGIPTPDMPGKIRAQLTDEESWLVGAAFKIGSGLLDTCSFILHDQHYYGISLAADWLEEAIGQRRLIMAYIPGPTPGQDRFRTNFRIPALDFLGDLKSGELAIEWAVNLDFLLDVGFPWATRGDYDWFRTFSIPAGTYEAKMGYFFEKTTALLPSDKQSGKRTFALSAGMGFYAGYYVGYTTSIIWINAGIGVFAVLQGTLEFIYEMNDNTSLPNPFKGRIHRMEVVGVLGILAYVDGGIDVWILSARIRASLQASLTVRVTYIQDGTSALIYNTNLSARYSASVRVGKGPFKWTFRVRGSYGVPVNGEILLN